MRVGAFLFWGKELILRKIHRSLSHNKPSMKKFIYVCAIALLVFQTRTYAQNIHLLADSVTKLLCKTWEVDYALVQGKKVNMPSSTPKIYIVFHKDGTCSAVGGKSKPSEKGRWEYDAQMGTIFMIVEKERKSIISLTKTQFVVSADDQVAVPNDSLRIKVYFKVKPTTR